jgi:DNA-directed RNA polymerase subunit RPC12/RpoP
MCLQCGRKFLFTPPNPPVTNVTSQTTINIAGTPQYTLDVAGARPAKAIMKTRLEQFPEEFPAHEMPDFETLDQGLNWTGFRAKTYSGLRRSYQTAVAAWSTFLAVFLIASTWLLAASSLWIALSGLGFIWAAIGLCCVLLDGRKVDKAFQERDARRRDWEEQHEVMGRRSNEKIIASLQPICPYCGADANSHSNGLTHCLRCGKQFHYADGKSFPIKFR